MATLGPQSYNFGQDNTLGGGPQTATMFGVGGVAPDLAAQIKARQANQAMLLDVIGLSPRGQIAQSGGLLQQPFFNSILGNTLPDVVGGVTGNINLPGGLPGGGGGTGGGGSLFDQLLQARGQFGEEIMGRIGEFGESHRARIGRDFETAAANAAANLERRGLGSSSLAPVTASAVEEGRQQSLLGLEDALLGREIGALSNIGEGLFSSVENELQRGLSRQGMALDLVGGVLNSALSF